jgi:hypothetical protein
MRKLRWGRRTAPKIASVTANNRKHGVGRARFGLVSALTRRPAASVAVPRDVL